MRVSVIVSTYERPDFLRKVLRGYLGQASKPFEILIADDGSAASTAALIEDVRGRFPHPLRHVWHPRAGFKKPAILNKAIAAATGDYLIFTDGDCIPRSDFVAAHARRARPNRFLSGGTFRLPRSVSEALTFDEIECGNVFDRGWLMAKGVPTSAWGKMGLPLRFGRLLSKATTTRATFNGHNSSAWRSDVERVNGFDERMVYGGLDREIGERLENAGVRGLGIRYEAICVHLDHDRDYANEAGLASNRIIRSETRSSAAAWTPFGLKKNAH